MTKASAQKGFPPVSADCVEICRTGRSTWRKEEERHSVPDGEKDGVKAMVGESVQVPGNEQRPMWD